MDNLRRLRSVLKISQVRLSQRSSVPLRYVQEWEQGLRELDKAEQLQILRVLRQAVLNLQTYLSGTFGGGAKRQPHRRRVLAKT